MNYRFRYYNSMDVQDKKDRRSWYTVHDVGPESEVPVKLLEASRMMFELRNTIYETSPNEPDEFDVLMIQGNCDKVIKMAMEGKKPWLNVEKRYQGRT